MKTILIITFIVLLFVAPVAGADEITCQTACGIVFGFRFYEQCEKFCDIEDDKTVKEAKYSEPEKWKEDCDFWLQKALVSRSADNYAWAINNSIPYCTRYNSALLEEIREKIK